MRVERRQTRTPTPPLPAAGFGLACSALVFLAINVALSFLWMPADLSDRDASQGGAAGATAPVDDEPKAAAAQPSRGYEPVEDGGGLGVGGYQSR